MTPLNASSQARGIQISGVVTSTAGATVHDNTVTVIEKANNAEYGGLPAGRARTHSDSTTSDQRHGPEQHRDRGGRPVCPERCA